MASPSMAEKLARQKRWESKRPKHYRYKLRVSCDCRFNTQLYQDQLTQDANFGWLLIEMIDEHILSVKTFEGKDYPDYARQVDYKNPIDAAFYMIGFQTELGYEKLYAVFDQEMGFPRFYLDTGEKGPGGNIFRFELMEFENFDKN